MPASRAFGQSLPTVWILYFLCWSPLSDGRGYRETYVGGDTQLDISLEVNPEGWFQGPEGRVHFWGYFLRGGEETPVVGYRVRHGDKRFTFFEIEGKRFVGETLASHCPATLSYTLVDSGAAPVKGTLTGGMCY